MKVPLKIEGQLSTPDETLAAINMFLAAQHGHLPSAPKHPRDISGQLNREFFNVLRQFPKVHCLAPTKPACPEMPISSHSIQRATTLSFLSDATGHVVGFKVVPDTKEGAPRPQVERIGINDASTFAGLCATHDAATFRSIESGSLLRPTTHQLLFLAYRGALRQLVQQQIDAHRSLQLASAAEADTWRDDVTKSVLRSQAVYALRGFGHCLQVKRELDKAVRRGSPGQACHSTYRVVPPVGFAVSAMITPLQDFEGRQIWGTWEPAAVILSVLPSTDGTLVAITVPKSSHLKARHLIRQCRAAEDDRLVSMVWRLALEGSENIFINPDAWGALSAEQQQTTLRFWHETHFVRPVPTLELAVPQIRSRG
jgi:hypothetical protein